MQMLPHGRVNATVPAEITNHLPTHLKKGAHTRPARSASEDGTEGAKPPLLGIYAKTNATLQPVGLLSRHLVQGSEGLPLETEYVNAKDGSTRLQITEACQIRESRASMYRLKSVVNGLLPESRTSKCLRWIAVTGGTVHIRQSIATGRCRYTGLQICSSVWTCPACARRISEVRRQELITAVGVARQLGETVLMVTTTVKHGMGDDLAEVLAKLAIAQKHFTTGREAAYLRQLIGLCGSIRAQEVTFGANGWHPHFHTLFFIKGLCGPRMELDRLRLKRLLFVQWWKACKFAGLVTSYKHGLNVSSEEKDVSGYIGKWGIESEMTKSNYKIGNKPDSFTPWGLLQHIYDKGPSSSLFIAKFVEYAAAFKGQRQLFWSPGLKLRLLGDAGLSDADIAADDMTDAWRILAGLGIAEWTPITRYNLESTLMSIAETDHSQIMPFIFEAQQRWGQDRSNAECDRLKIPRVQLPKVARPFTPVMAPSRSNTGVNPVDCMHIDF